MTHEKLNDRVVEVVVNSQRLGLKNTAQASDEMGIAQSRPVESATGLTIADRLAAFDAP